MEAWFSFWAPFFQGPFRAFFPLPQVAGLSASSLPPDMALARILWLLDVMKDFKSDRNNGCHHSSTSTSRASLWEEDTYCDYLYFFKSYLSANADLSSSGIDLIYPFHPGHQLMCHFHNRPKIDLELLSYFALKLHFSQSFEDIRRSPYS